MDGTSDDHSASWQEDWTENDPLDNVCLDCWHRAKSPEGSKQHCGSPKYLDRQERYNTFDSDGIVAPFDGSTRCPDCGQHCKSLDGLWAHRGGPKCQRQQESQRAMSETCLD